jgi:hypothetical protein
MTKSKASSSVALGCQRATVFAALGAAVAWSGCNRDPGADATSQTESNAAPESSAGPTGSATPPSAASANGAAATSATSVRRYEVESGIVTFEQKGVQTGIETLYFKDFGRLELRESRIKLSLPNMPQLTGLPTGTTHTMTIFRDGVMTNWDVNTKKGTRIANVLEFLGGQQKLAGKNLTHFGIEMIRELGGVKTGTRSIAGHACEVWNIKKLYATTCIHKGISLDASVDVMNMKQTTVATKVELGAKVDDAKFLVPPDVAVREVDARDAMGAAAALGGLGGPASSGAKRGAPVKLEEALEMMKKFGKQPAEPESP